MSAVIMQKTRTRFEQESVRRLTTDQKAYAFDGYFHYSGKWLIEKNEDLVHSVEFSLNPDFVGTKQRRNAELSGGSNLVLSAQEKDNVGVIRHHFLEWQR